jgi:hypothetical protein
VIPVESENDGRATSQFLDGLRDGTRLALLLSALYLGSVLAVLLLAEVLAL